MEKKVNKIYRESYDDISKKWYKYMESHAPKVEKAWNELQDALRSGDKDRVKDTKDEYMRTVKNVTVNDERFRAMRDETAAKISHTNEVALDYINGNMANIYTINYNAFGTEKVAGYSFALVNENAVKELATNDKALLPTKKLDIPKDMRWNEKMINSQMLQGILQGESITKIADRLQNITNMNRTSAIRNTRTMTTAAENKGRQDSFKKASDDGVLMKRRWIATHDERTRAWHADLDGVEVDVDEPFENEFGDIMYPGDPSADPANVYNCRCSVRAVVAGFAWNKEIKDETEQEENTEGLLDKYKEQMLSGSSKEKLRYIFNSDPDLAFSLGGASDEEINSALIKIFDEHNTKVEILGKEYLHIDKSSLSYLHSTMNVTDEDIESMSHYIKNLDSFTINQHLREDKLDDLPDYLKDTVSTMDKVIAENPLKESINVVRFADEKYLSSILDMNMDDIRTLSEESSNLESALESLKGLEITEKSYFSTSADVDANVFSNYSVKLNVLADKGTPAYFTNNIEESEVLFGRNSKYSIEQVKVERDENYSRNKIEMTVRLING